MFEKTLAQDFHIGRIAEKKWILGWHAPTSPAVRFFPSQTTVNTWPLRPVYWTYQVWKRLRTSRESSSRHTSRF